MREMTPWAAVPFRGHPTPSCDHQWKETSPQTCTTPADSIHGIGFKFALKITFLKISRLQSRIAPEVGDCFPFLDNTVLISMKRLETEDSFGR